jgi:putative transposase
MEHRKKIKHFQSVRQLHELTFSCFNRRPLLTNEAWREMLSRSIDDAGEHQGFQLNAFVFMPEHVHLLVTPISETADVSKYLAQIKRPFSAKIESLLAARRSGLLKQLTVEERPGKFSFRYWQEGPGFDRNLTEESLITVAVDYFHANPVKRRLVVRAVDWRWSSARFYLTEPRGRQFPELPTVTRVSF